MSLELAAAQWLKYEKRCALVLCERSPRSWHAGQPDVLGILQSRYLLEIEIKRSLSDFRANAKKRHIQNRFSQDDGISKVFREMAPKQFWFMVPENLVEKVLPELPDYAGLMTEGGGSKWAKVVRPSPTNAESKKLSLKECSELMRNAGNQIISIMQENSYKSKWRDCVMDSTGMDEFFVTRYGAEPDYSNFQI